MSTKKKETASVSKFAKRTTSNSTIAKYVIVERTNKDENTGLRSSVYTTEDGETRIKLAYVALDANNLRIESESISFSCSLESYERNKSKIVKGKVVPAWDYTISFVEGDDLIFSKSGEGESRGTAEHSFKWGALLGWVRV